MFQTKAKVTNVLVLIVENKNNLTAEQKRLNQPVKTNASVKLEKVIANNFF